MPPRDGSRARRATPRAMLLASGEPGVGLTVTTALLATTIRREGASVTVLTQGPRAARIARCLGAAAGSDDQTGSTRLPEGIALATDWSRSLSTDVVIGTAAVEATGIREAARTLAAQAPVATAALLFPAGPASAAVAFAVLKTMLAERPAPVPYLLPLGDADPEPIRSAAARWLGRSPPALPAMPWDATLHDALRLGIPVPDAFADPAAQQAADAIWTCLSSHTPLGDLS